MVLAAASAACTTSSETASSGSGNGNGDGSGGGGGGGSGASKTVSSSDCMRRCKAKAATCGADEAAAEKACSQSVCNEPLTERQVTCLEGLACEDTSKSFAELCPAGEGGGEPPPSKPTTTCGSETCGEGEYCSQVYNPQTSEWDDDTCKAMPTACKDKTLSQVCTCLEEAICPPANGSDILQKHCSTGTSGTAFGCRSVAF